MEKNSPPPNVPLIFMLLSKIHIKFVYYGCILHIYGEQEISVVMVVCNCTDVLADVLKGVAECSIASLMPCS